MLRTQFLMESADLESVSILLEALTQLDAAYLRNHPRTPRLYESGVRYEVEWGEEWLTVPFVLQHGRGDCEDLGAWRAAELRLLGYERAVAFPIVAPSLGGLRLIHILVSREGTASTVEDPSARLGMPAIPPGALSTAVERSRVWLSVRSSP